MSVRKGLRHDLLPLQRIILGLDGSASSGVSRNKPGLMMTCRKRYHRSPDQSHLPHQVVIHPDEPGQSRHKPTGQETGRFWYHRRNRENRKNANLIYETSPQVALKPIPAWQLLEHVHECLRGLGELRTHIHVNWSFPTPIIISFTSSSFLTYPYSFRCVCDGQPVPNCCCIPPAVTFVVIDHDGDMSLPIYLVPEMWATTRRCR